MGAYISMVQDGKFMFLDLPDLFFGYAEICSEYATANMLCIGWHATSGVQYQRTDTVLDTLLPQC
jgi:hypothetical protein